MDHELQLTQRADDVTRARRASGQAADAAVYYVESRTLWPPCVNSYKNPTPQSTRILFI